MTIEQRFIASDGKEFKTEKECIDYENFKSVITDTIPTLKKIREMCHKQTDCDFCIFRNSVSEHCLLKEEFPEYWDLESIGD